MLGLATDITALRVQESRHDELRRRLSVATEAAGIGIWDWHVAENILDWDEHMFRLYGISRDDFSGAYSAWQSGLHPEDREVSEQAIRDALAGTHPFDICFRVVWPSGEVRYIQAAAHVERDMDGTPVRMIGTNWDITNQKRIENDLVSAKNAAEVATHAKSEFLANMSHEIRTPINGVIGMVNIALKHENQEEQRRRLNSVRQSATSLLAIINDILDFSKVEAGQLQLENIEFDLLKVISETVEVNAVNAIHKELEIVVDASGVVEYRLMGDPGRIKQIINNLLSNAIKFTERGDIVIHLTSTPCASGKHLIECSITDSGIGIEQEKISRLFEPFTQADSSTTRLYGGTGLGLSIVKKLCAMMEGDVNATSAIGKGSCFSFHLHLHSVVDRKLSQIPCGIISENVLVVEPKAASRHAISNQLSAWGQKVFSGLLKNPKNAIMARHLDLE